MRLMVTRFNTKTWNEFLRYRDKKDIKGYIYGTPVRIKNNIPVDEILIVFEMHNDLNKVMGISLVKNYLRMDKICLILLYHIKLSFPNHPAPFPRLKVGSRSLGSSTLITI